MTDDIQVDTCIVSKVKRWLEVEFPNMTWEQDVARPDCGLVSRRLGIDGNEEHFFVLIMPTYCCASGKPRWPSATRATPLNAYSADFWFIVQDIKALCYRYDEEVRYALSKRTIECNKPKNKARSNCAIQ